MIKRIIVGITILLFTALLLTFCAAQKEETAKTDIGQPEFPSLQSKLDEKAAGFEERASEEIKKIFSDGVRAVAESGVMQTALKVGDTAPGFTLPNAVGENVTLAVALQSGPVILTWYRGGW